MAQKQTFPGRSSADPRRNDYSLFAARPRTSGVACRVGDQKSVSAGAKRLDSRGAGQEPRLLGLDEFNRFPEPIPSPVVNAS